MIKKKKRKLIWLTQFCDVRVDWLMFGFIEESPYNRRVFISY